MKGSLDALFETIAAPTGGDTEKPLYAVLPVAGYHSYFIGKDRDSCACLLVTTVDHVQRQSPPIRLESLDVQFELPCHLRQGKEPEKQGQFTVICCRSLARETVRYFLSVCETILCVVGDRPKQRAVSSAVHRLAAIFQKTKNPPARTVNGLFGELYLISLSSNPVRTLTAWRVDETARYDFVDGEVRLDVKATGGRTRTHFLSYEQCNPPAGTIAVAASMFVERVSRGLTLRSLIDDIVNKVASHFDLVFKLHEVIAGTLGTNLDEAMAAAFDEKLAESSLSFYNLATVPAIRTPLPEGVSDVHFQSDLSAADILIVQDLIDQNPIFGDLLPWQGQS